MGEEMDGAPRVVLVDDDPLISDIILECLNGLGCDSTLLDDGLDLMSALWSVNPQLVILDCNLPGRPGMMLLEDIRRSAPNPAIPVLMLTGRQGSWNETVAKRHGVSEYMRKPFDRDVFKKTVARMISRSAADVS
jgi:DNA-binding response OmpR family regulator